jgi:hypothetical protein
VAVCARRERRDEIAGRSTETDAHGTVVLCPPWSNARSARFVFGIWRGGWLRDKLGGPINYLPDFGKSLMALAFRWRATVAAKLDDVVGGSGCHGRADVVSVIRFESGNRQEMKKKVLGVLSYGVGGVEVSERRGAFRGS